jgi:hypothetical protein
MTAAVNAAVPKAIDSALTNTRFLNIGVFPIKLPLNYSALSLLENRLPTFTATSNNAIKTRAQ